jgi:putative NADH-flavin reductase
MKIALIGATGFVGSAILNEALDRGHEVTAISRNPAKQEMESSNIHPVKADVLKENEVARAVKGHDAVISSYNPGWANPNIYNEYLLGSQSIEAGVLQSGVKRLLVIGGAGSLFVEEGLQLIDTANFPQEWKPGALAAKDYLNILRKNEELDWTFLSPAIEMHQGTSGERKGRYRSGLENPVFDAKGRSIISVEDLAISVLDEIEKPQHIRQRYTVAY